MPPNPEEICIDNNVKKLFEEMRRLSDGSKDFFLWELVCNSVRALRQIRLESLIKEELLGTEKQPIIDIVIDKENNSLSVIDNGIGMTKADLMGKLFSIKDLELQNYRNIIHEREENPNLSCLYSPDYVGFGLFSAYLVAEKVVITTKHNGHEQYVWESDGCGTFTIALDTSADRLVRGTKVTLFLKRVVCDEYLDGCKLEVLVASYPPDMRPYPIYISDVGNNFSKRVEPSVAAGGMEKDVMEKFELLQKLFVKVLKGYVENIVLSDHLRELPYYLSIDKTLTINTGSKKMLKLSSDAADNPDDENVVASIYLCYFCGRSIILAYDRKYGTSYAKNLPLYRSTT